ncbi:hypothetical protein N0V90_006901 [Kalmusia sp. IMI 367209]|nr:hypothetical protein N0V90_006901 [Kalmusia sp. IMI 367209]
MSGIGAELFPSYSDVVARREWEVGFAKERLEKMETVDLPLCRIERVSADERTARFGLKRGKLLYVFKYPLHDVERDKHRNVITRARFIKQQLEAAGYRLIPWDFKKGQPPRFWESETMEEDDDDLYGPSEPTQTAQKEAPKNEDDVSSGDEPMDEGDESGDDDDEDDSDSDIDIIIDKPATAPKPAQPSQPQESKAIKIEAPPQASTASSQAPRPTAPQAGIQAGTAYPGIHSSNINVDADPVYTPEGKPIMQVDLVADLAESSKAWRVPGADQSDYFNYGFDEFTWEMYRSKQMNMAAAIETQKAEVNQMQHMFGQGPGMPGMSGPASSGPGIPNAPTGPAAGPGMMDEGAMMQMMQQMNQQGMDMSTMDFNQFMQMAQQGGMGGFGGPAGNQGGFGGGAGGPGGGVGGGRRGGRGRGNW